MKRSTLVPIGLVLVLLGGLWAMQGFGFIGGSAMSGEALWAVVGTILVVAGLALVARGAIRPRDH